MVEYKTPGEIDAMRAAGQVVARILAAVRARAAPGVRLSELDATARDVLAEARATSPFLGYQPAFADTPFPAVICASVNDAALHDIPGRYRLKDGDLLSVDCGATLDGWATSAEEGCGNVAQLFREISALGYDGSYSTVRDYFEQYRPAAAPLTPPPPSVREVTGWVTRHPDSLTEDEQPQLKALLERCPELHAASAHVRTFATMLTQLTGHDLPQWISDARAAGLPGISSFAKGLEQDLDAVTQGLTSRWNSGPSKAASTTSK